MNHRSMIACLFVVSAATFLPDCSSQEKVKPVNEQLKTVKITRIVFNETLSRTCLEFIRRKLRSLKEPVRVNFIYCFPLGEKQPIISLEIENMNIEDALRLICKKSGLRMVSRGNTIAFYPANYQQRKVVRVSNSKKSRALAKALEDVTIRKLRFLNQNATVALLRVLAQVDESTNTDHEVKFEATVRRITLQVTDLSAKDILGYICECMGWEYRIEGHRIVFSDFSPPLQTNKGLFLPNFPEE